MHGGINKKRDVWSVQGGNVHRDPEAKLMLLTSLDLLGLCYAVTNDFK